MDRDDLDITLNLVSDAIARNQYGMSFLPICRLEVCEEALLRLVPEKPVKKIHRIMCPECRGPLATQFNFCPNCGQRILRSENENK